MLSIAIVEDDENYTKTLCRYIKQYAEESGESFHINTYKDGLSFLASNEERNIIFMDIEMPIMDGMKASSKLRKFDQTSTLIFVTNMANYAVKGYEVDAMDFLVKPIDYFVFSLKLEKAVRLQKSKINNFVVIQTIDGVQKLDVMSLYYIESDQHYVVCHTENGDYRCRESLKNMEKLLETKNFVRCNNSFLVNMAHVDKIEGDTVQVGKQILSISRSRKKAFMDAMTIYFRAL